MSGLVVAAIGFQLLLSVSSAASACSGTLDRSARRIPSSVVHAFREIVERATPAEPAQIQDPGFRLSDSKSIIPSTAPRAVILPLNRAINIRRLNLPPPMMG